LLDSIRLHSGECPLRGKAGARLVDQAWRTAGVRELVTIPLYLTTLLSLLENAPFPNMKEEVLSHLVAAHEKEVRRAEALRAVAQGFQQDYLEGLAVLATRTANTAIADSNARRSISETETLLVTNGQITIKPQPAAVLDVLVSSHVLIRAGDTPGYSFQHQQFQEWYASHSVERRIMAEATDSALREALKAEVLNLPTWEEAILFAVERLARGDTRETAACGKAILSALLPLFRATSGTLGPTPALPPPPLAHDHPSSPSVPPGEERGTKCVVPGNATSWRRLRHFQRCADRR
jgi:hypothetical protein